MLSAEMIGRYARRGQWDRLLKELVANGLPVPPPLYVRLSATPLTSLALGLRRALELSYGPSPVASALAAELVHGVRSDTIEDPLLAAAVAAALTRLNEAGNDVAGHDAQHFSALQGLAITQGDDGLFGGDADRTTQDRALVSAFVLFLLNDHDDFRAHVRYADLLGWFEQHQDDLEPATETLWLMATMAEVGSVALAA